MLGTDSEAGLRARHAATRPYAQAERALLQAALARPGRLSDPDLATLRLSLRLARVCALPQVPAAAIPGALAALRDRGLPFARRLVRARKLDPAGLRADAALLRPLVERGCQALLAASGGQLDPAWLRAELCETSLVLVLGGGGGTGYAHLGAFSLLEQLGLRPALIAGASAGALTGAFRARSLEYRDAAAWAVAHSLNLRLFRLLDPAPSVTMPGLLRMTLREPMTRFFQAQGRPLRLDELPIPLLVATTGVRRDRGDRAPNYTRMLSADLPDDPVARLLHLGALVRNLALILGELRRSRGLSCVTLGADLASRELDVIDAVGLSSALPGLLQYSPPPEAARSQDLLRSLLDQHRVTYLADGGITANVPVQAAWDEVQRGRLGHRNGLFVALDGFAADLPAHLPYLPLAKIAAENVRENIPYADIYFAYRRPPPPSRLIPRGRSLERTIRRARGELEPLAPLLKAATQPLPPPACLAEKSLRLRHLYLHHPTYPP